MFPRAIGRTCIKSPTASMTAFLLSMVWGCPVALDVQGPNSGDGATVSFRNQIQPVLSTMCFRCHRPGGIADLAGIALQVGEEVAYDSLVNQPSVQDPSRTLVVPGDAESSLLLVKVGSGVQPFGVRMPLGGPALSEGVIALIRDWIDQGALEN